MNVRCECGEAATANGRECPRCFRQRLLSVRLDTSVTETRTKKNYFDRGPLDQVFGEDRVDRYWDETEGQGAISRGPDGQLWHQPKGRDPQIAAPELIEEYLGPEVEDAI